MIKRIVQRSGHQFSFLFGTMRVFVCLVLFFAAASAAPAWDCKHDDTTVCLGLRAVAYVEKLTRMDNVQLIDGISFVGSGNADRAGRALSEAELENSLPEESSQKTARLFDMFIDAAMRFLKTHTLQFKLPESAPADLQRAFDEGRGKIKKTILPIVIGIAAKIFTVIPLFIGGLALIATKALVIAKIAFIIVAVIGLQKVLGGSGGGLAGLKGGLGGGWSSGSSYSNAGNSGWSSGASSGGPYHRSFNEMDAQDLAYKAHTA